MVELGAVAGELLERGPGVAALLNRGAVAGQDHAGELAIALAPYVTPDATHRPRAAAERA